MGDLDKIENKVERLTELMIESNPELESKINLRSLSMSQQALAETVSDLVDRVEKLEEKEEKEEEKEEF